ncbi:MAG: DNA-binding protein [Planctomycetaceae bacterium]
MTTIAVPISEERHARLRELADQAGVPPEEFLRLRVDRLLEQPDEAFEKAAEHVLRKNSELYRRLA